ncbi:MAG: hypothetical protein OEV68_06750, partial [candidate division Zixibacteria bacterium]|nr:hypothetical protein [candidate division Zixibacteria bacterium]
MSSRQDTSAQGILFLVLLAGILVFSNADLNAESINPRFEVFGTDEPISWFAARDSAENHGGYLAIITSAAEQAEVAALLSESDTAWMGGFDVLIEGKWVWLNGEAWSYDNWNVPHPWPSGSYDYLQIVGSAGGKWESAASHTDAYVVEYECCIESTGN